MTVFWVLSADGFHLAFQPVALGQNLHFCGIQVVDYPQEFSTPAEIAICILGPQSLGTELFDVGICLGLVAHRNAHQEEVGRKRGEGNSFNAHIGVMFSHEGFCGRTHLL